jgi:hypothetical protein
MIKKKFTYTFIAVIVEFYQTSNLQNKKASITIDKK